MLIAGFQKTSFVDFPGAIAAVVFTPYCNFDCVYCHNDHILGKDAPLIDEEQVLSFLEKRKDVLQAVVVSGGEPTLQQGLETFLRRVRAMGYQTKLDTNGSKPQAVKALLSAALVDYVAMDVKAPLCKYAEIARTSVDVDAIQKSIAILRNGTVKHEFRLTFAPQLTKADAVEAAKLVRGCEAFYLQQYRPRHADDPCAHAPAYVREAAEEIKREIGVCVLRGLGA